MSVVRVGDTVYDTGKIIAQRIRGSWCKERRGSNCVDFDPVEDQASYEQLPDVLQMDMGKMELGLTNHMSKILNTLKARRVPHFPDDFIAYVTTSFSEGVVCGLRKYGPYEPRADTRDIRAMILRKSRNLLVYLCLYSIQQRKANDSLYKLTDLATQRVVRVMLDIY